MTPQVPNLHHKIHSHFPTPVTTFSNVRNVGCIVHPPPQDTSQCLLSPPQPRAHRERTPGVPPLDLAPALHGYGRDRELKSTLRLRAQCQVHYKIPSNVKSATTGLPLISSDSHRGTFVKRLMAFQPRVWNRSQVPSLCAASLIGLGPHGLLTWAGSMDTHSFRWLR